MAKISCRFFAQGRCKNGDSCIFAHINNHLEANFDRTVDSTPSEINPASNKSTSNQICKYFLQGSCYYGEDCHNIHLPQVSETRKVENFPKLPLKDSRGTIPCKFTTVPGGCSNKSCPYLHDTEVSDNTLQSSRYQEIDENEDPEDTSIPVRNMMGAEVSFDEFGQILTVSFPTDFSMARVSGFPIGITNSDIIDLLKNLDFHINVKSIRVLAAPQSSSAQAIIKVQQPGFARILCDKLKENNLSLSAVSIPVQSGLPSARKLDLSWHKASRSVWLNFNSKIIAHRVAQKFNHGIYKCLGRLARSTPPETTSYGRGRNIWTIILSDVPGEATRAIIENSIRSNNDKPMHIELGPISYYASDEEVRAVICSLLQKYETVEEISFPPALSNGKRAKATALFLNDDDAKSACVLNGASLDILNKGKLTVSLLQSIQVKVSTKVYHVMKNDIEIQYDNWQQRQITFRCYSDASQSLTTLKMKGSNSADLLKARRELDEILKPVTMDQSYWSPLLVTNGPLYEKLMSVAKDLNAIIIRDRSKRRLKFYGSNQNHQQIIDSIRCLFEEQPPSTLNYEIDLSPNLFAWALHGGFERISQQLEENVAIFDVVSKKILINGSNEQYEKALRFIDSENHLEEISQTAARGEDQIQCEKSCPICFCEAESPVQMSCMHTYCLDCLEQSCERAASSSTGQENFLIKCYGAEGSCATIFNLKELRNLVSSSAFESMLENSFEEYVKCRPEDFRSCPTPACEFIYRRIKTQDQELSVYTCPNCIKQFCRLCDAQHDGYTCAEYKYKASGDFEAVEKLKKELNIKDCPKCKTPIEKTEGCNHMTCAACKAHICWVCLEHFTTSTSCYKHLNERHGTIYGAEYDQFVN